MKKVIVTLMFVFSLSLVSSACVLDVTLLNQDPYPAVPGDYVKLVFQVTGTENPECKSISFELLEKYPIEFDAGEKSIKQIKGGTFQRDFSSSIQVPYKVRIDQDALDGENQIEVMYTSTDEVGTSSYSELFNIEVDDTRADFEIYIKDYDAKTKKLTFEILNIAESDVEAVTVEIPPQDTIKITGAKTNIIGDIDSNEYTTADFIASPSAGNIVVMISYSDTINVRRSVEKIVNFDPDYFALTVTKQQTPWYTYVIAILVIGGIVWFFLRRRKKRHAHRKHTRGSARLG